MTEHGIFQFLRVHSEGSLIDLEKHNWEWAAVIVPLMPVDLFELANNHD